MDRSLVNKDLNNFAPRVGLAFDVFGNQKTVIRSRLRDLLQPASFNAVSLHEPEPRRSSSESAQTIQPPAQRLCRRSGPSRRSRPFWAIRSWACRASRPYDIDFRTPYFQQYNFGIQQLLTRNLLVEAQYLGLQGGTHLYTNVLYNLPNPSATTPIAARALFPNLGNFALQAGAASSNYNAGILRVEKRLSFGLMVSGSYTFSKSHRQRFARQHGRLVGPRPEQHQGPRTRPVELRHPAPADSQLHI